MIAITRIRNSTFPLEEIIVKLNKTLLSSAVAATIGVTGATVSTQASAAIITGTWDGIFTMLDSDGGLLFDTGGSTGNAPWLKTRTDITGTLSFNTSTGAGSGTVTSFSFFGRGLASATSVSFQSIGGTLVLGNMGFDWNGNVGIPVSIVLDAAGFFGCLGDGFSKSEICTGGVLPASDGHTSALGGPTADGNIGQAVMATTTWNTTTINGGSLGQNPSGTLPLIADKKSVGGSPMKSGPFAGFNANFDITSVHITSDPPGPVVPVPAAVWLFGSGLLGLVGVARRRKSA
jgi:hypothetical protein